MARTAQLFEFAPRVHRMHVVDAGQGMALFKCRTCNHSSGWIEAPSVSASKRRIPCPNCNGDQPIDEQWAPYADRYPFVPVWLLHSTRS